MKKMLRNLSIIMIKLYNTLTNPLITNIIMKNLRNIE